MCAGHAPPHPGGLCHSAEARLGVRRAAMPQSPLLHNKNTMKSCTSVRGGRGWHFGLRPSEQRSVSRTQDGGIVAVQHKADVLRRSAKEQQRRRLRQNLAGSTESQ